LHHDAGRQRRFFSRIEVLQSRASFDPPNGGARSGSKGDATAWRGKRTSGRHPRPKRREVSIR
jgi:hypothetical protein